MMLIKHYIEYALVRILFKALSSLPLDAASFIGGFMARSIGPFLSAHRTAKRNIHRVFPDITAEKEKRILTRMWDNLGRVAAEMAHLSSDRLYQRITLHQGNTLPDPGHQVLFFSGHIGNWELLSPIVYRNHIPTTLVYRKANNPLVDDFITRIRETQAHNLLPKGPTGAVKLVRSLKGGDSMAMLIDQKMNDGIAVPFFGTDVMTAPAIAEFALRYQMPIIPARVIRTQGCHFAATVYPPLAFTPSGDQEKDVLAIMTQINAIVEEWVREHPDQWFWVHKRWPKDGE
jgi:Kdo2-lipid IVA lauroyltransferase/acyltransferase